MNYATMKMKRACLFICDHAVRYDGERVISKAECYKILKYYNHDGNLPIVDMSVYDVKVPYIVAHDFISRYLNIAQDIKFMNNIAANAQYICNVPDYE